MLTRHLITAYCRTSYWVFIPAEYVRLRIAIKNESFDARLRGAGVERWAYITAYNPGSRLLSPAENRQRHDDLVEKLRGSGSLVWPGLGVGDDPDWPPEESLLVGDLRPNEARDLARQFGQHAVVVGETGEPPELLFTDPQAAVPLLRETLQTEDPAVKQAAETALRRTQ